MLYWSSLSCLGWGDHFLSTLHASLVAHMVVRFPRAHIWRAWVFYWTIIVYEVDFPIFLRLGLGRRAHIQ